MEMESSTRTWFDRLEIAVTDRKASATVYRPRENLRRTAFAALLVLVLLGPLMTFGGISVTDDGAVERQIGYILILGLTLYSVFPVSTRGSLIAIPAPVLIAFGWCLLSMTWAIDVGSGLRRLILTLTVAWTVFLLVRHSSYRSVINVSRWCLVVGIAASYMAVVFAPAIGIHPMADAAIATAIAGNWRGIFGHKNFAGPACALCILMFLFDAKQIRPQVRVAVILIAAYFLFRSQSKTSEGMLLLSMVGGGMFHTVNRRLRAYLMPIVTVGGSLLWLAGSAYKNVIMTNFLDPTAFTGRGLIWATLIKYAGDHLLTGAGFGSFWNIGGNSPVFSYGQGFVTKITVGHSGYLDQLAAVGLPGMLLMVFAAMVWPFWKLLSRHDIPPARGALIVAMLIFCIGNNVTESGLFERDAIVSTFLFMTVALAQYTGGRERSRSSSRSAKRGTGDDLLAKMRDRNGRTATG